MIQVGDVSFAVDGKIINKANARMRACELAAQIKRRNDDNVITRVHLGTLLRGCTHAFGWKQCELAAALCLHPNMVSRAIKLSAALDDGSGQVVGDGRVGPGSTDWARLDETRLPPTEAQAKAGEKGDLPCLTILEDLLGVRKRPTRTNEAAKFSRREKNDGDTRRHGPAGGVASVNTPTPWRSGDAGSPEQERISSPPPVSGPAGGDAGAHGHDPEPSAGPGRASTRAQAPAGGGTELTPPPEVGPAGGARPGRAAPHRQAGAAVGVPVGATQMTMDALYAGAISGAERLLADLAELLEKDGLDAGKVMAAQLCISDGLGYLREAGGPGREAGGRGEKPKTHAAASRVRDDGRGRAG